MQSQIERKLFESVGNTRLVVLVLILLGISVLLELPVLPHFSPFLFVTIVIFWLILSFFHALKQSWMLAIIYHAIYALGIVYVFAYPSPLLFLATTITYMTDLLMGRKYFWLSFTWLAGAIVVHFLYGAESLTLEIFVDLFQTLAVVTTLAVMQYEILAVTRKEISDLEETKNEEQIERQRLLSLINTIGDAVIATDDKGVIQNYNGAALDLLDTNENLKGKVIDSIWHIETVEGVRVGLLEEAQRIKTNMRRSDLRLCYSAADKANLYVNMTPIVVSGFGPRAAKGYTIIMRDISKEKSLEEERDEFISVVSHELRTPITITEGKVSNAQLMLKKPHVPKKKVADSLEQAHAQVVFLSNMINDLANLSRAERDDVDIDTEIVDPAQMVTKLVSTYSIDASAQNLTISSHIGHKPAIRPIMTNRLYLEEILQNFITNALKYTKDGGVTVSVRQRSLDVVEFAVQDTGIGMSTSDQKRIFEKFFRSEDYRTRESNGTGLGLYVTAKLAKKIKATIKVTSKLNHGTTFTISVPFLHERARRR